jgi:hypothetical protein
MPAQTQILTRRGDAATWTSTNPTLGAGEIGYETDTGKFKIGTGAATWTSLGYFNQDPVTTKGDLYTFSTTDARLAVGNDGETLVADSSATTGLSWQGNYASGKNKIINGDFGVWQRGTSFSNPANLSFTADRFKIVYTGSGSTFTVSQQTFTPGTAPVAGYEGQFFIRQDVTVAGSGETIRQHRYAIEDVRTFAGQTATLSFWAKADSARTLDLDMAQNFGSGGSGTVATAVSNVSLTTAWTRFEKVINVPSVSGKTIGAGSNLDIRLKMPLNTISTIDIWGVQFEAGSVATAFQTATGTKQGELAACQRYYFRTESTTATVPHTVGFSTTTTAAQAAFPLPVAMRTKPSAVEFSLVCVSDNSGYDLAITAITIAQGSTTSIGLAITNAATATAFRPCFIKNNNNAAGYLGFSAEF